MLGEPDDTDFEYWRSTSFKRFRVASAPRHPVHDMPLHFLPERVILAAVTLSVPSRGWTRAVATPDAAAGAGAAAAAAAAVVVAVVAA